MYEVPSTTKPGWAVAFSSERSFAFDLSFAIDLSSATDFAGATVFEDLEPATVVLVDFFSTTCASSIVRIQLYTCSMQYN